MTHPSVIPAPIEQHDRTGEGTPTASVLVPAAAHQVIAARLSGDTQCSDEAAGLYIDTVTVGPEGVLEVTVSDEHGASLAVTLASPGQPSSDTRTVQIPARDDHDGRASITVTLPWVCPSCGGPRGEVKRVVSYDGSRRLACDGWDNPWSDNTTALAHVRLVVKKRARRVYGFLAWSEGGKRQEVFLAEATAPTRAGNLAMMWRLVAEQNLLDPAVRSERTAQRRSTWERRRPPEDPASRP